MKQIIYIILGSILSLSSAWAQTAAIPDANFLSFLKSSYPKTINSSNQLITAQAALVSSSLNCSGKNISSIEGIEYFSGISDLNVSGNNLTSVSQIANLSGLKTVHAENNLLTSLPPLDSLTSLQLLIVHDNQLKSLPPLSNNVQLTQLVVFNNQLTVLPDLSKLVNLSKIDIGNNQLNAVPDLRANVRLQELSLDRNFLTKGPDLTAIDSLTLVQLHENYLSFIDLLPYTTYPGFSSNFTISPQKEFLLSNKDVLLNDSLDLSTNIDTSLSTISYTWYFSGKAINTVTNDSLIIYPANYANQGYYYCVFTCSALPGIQLTTDSMEATVIYCPSASDFTFDYQSINCQSNGGLKINLISLPLQPYIFSLKSVVTDSVIRSNTGVFNNLVEPEYILSAKVGTICTITLPTIKIPFEECKEAFITPNGDGENDTYFFLQTGTATIYDKNGVTVKTLTIPDEWDGTSKSGQKLSQGYYAANINNGADYVRISIIY